MDILFLRSDDTILLLLFRLFVFFGGCATPQHVLRIVRAKEGASQQGGDARVTRGRDAASPEAPARCVTQSRAC